MSELKAFDVGLGQYCEDGSPCVVAVDADQNPRLLNNEKVYLKSEADRYICHQKRKRCLAMSEFCRAKYDYEDKCVNGHGASWDYESKEMKYWERWRWRWDALADEPTWTKFLQLIHKETK